MYSNNEEFNSVAIEFNRRLNEFLRTTNAHISSQQLYSEIGIDDYLAKKRVLDSIKDNGTIFEVKLHVLFTVMNKAEIDYFKLLFEAANKAIQAPTLENCNNFQAEFNRFKMEINKYKAAHPFSAGLGPILINALILVLSLSLLLMGVIALSIATPPVGLVIAAQFIGAIGSFITLDFLFSSNRKTQYGFFNNAHINSAEKFVNDMEFTSLGLVCT
ncbi:hypothetical protein ACD661_16465 [Legionella lytica]|uniref:Uncharacterized protein n=1 Tax=Legionella lytica TaxID=96232 RepID=A0ABW8DDT0_9GAMM